VFQWGGLAVATLALFGLVAALVHCGLRRPFVQPGRVVALLALSGSVAVATLPFPYPTSHTQPSRVEFRLPVEGDWIVRWGGEHPRENVLVILPARCRGFDLERVEDGRTRRPESSAAGPALADWYAFDQPVLAPAAGEVVRVHGSERDRLPGTPWTGTEPAGNHVVVRVAPGEYLFLANLREGSVAVSVGDRVAQGSPIARVGNSGASRVSPNPHLAIHLQDTPDPGLGEGIPMRFSDYRTGARAVERGLPTGGVGLRGELLGDPIRSSPPPRTASSPAPPDSSR
jgi:hypothetical protein